MRSLPISKGPDDAFDGLAEVLHLIGVDAGATDVVVDIGDVVEGFVRDPTTELGRVTHIRISPTEESIRAPFAGWPEPMLRRISGGSVHLAGGTDLRGGQPVALEEERLDDTLTKAASRGADAFAVVAVGALLDEQTELTAAGKLAAGSGLPVALSHQIGGLRFMEREASTILNAALLKPVLSFLDRLQRVLDTVAPKARQSFLLADGSRLGREECRSFPVRTLGTWEAALAQGAAARCGVADAIVVLWAPGRIDLMTLEDGCLRAEPLRSFPDLLTGVQLSQRRAATLGLAADLLTDAIAPDLLRTDLALVVISTVHSDDVEAGEATSSAFDQFAVDLARQFPRAQVVTDAAEEIAALGAVAAHAQSEILKFAVPESLADLERARHSIRSVAQSRVLATDPLARPRTVNDTVAPLSFLEVGPVLMRVHIDGVRAGPP